MAQFFREWLRYEGVRTADRFGDYRDHDKLCVYYDGRLVWGSPP